MHVAVSASFQHSSDNMHYRDINNDGQTLKVSVLKTSLISYNISLTIFFQKILPVAVGSILIYDCVTTESEQKNNYRLRQK